MWQPAGRTGKSGSECAEALIEAELFAVVAYEVEDGADRLALGAAQASA